MASHRKMLIEILNYSAFISGDSVSYLQCSGSWEEVLLLTMDFLEFVVRDALFCLKKLSFAFLTDCVYWFLTSLKSFISRVLFDASAVRHRMFLCWSMAVRSGVNQGLYLFFIFFIEWAMLI